MDYRSRILDNMSSRDAGELVVQLPANFYDSKNQEQAVPDADMMQVDERHPQNSPLTIRVEYTIVQPKIGVYWVLPDDDAAAFRWPQAFTHNPVHHWLPCVENLHDKGTWEVEYVVPRFLRRRLGGGAVEERETMVASTGVLLEQLQHPQNPQKKIFYYASSIPILTSSFMWAVGPFEVTKLENWSQLLSIHQQADQDLPEEDDEMEQMEGSEDEEGEAPRPQSPAPEEPRLAAPVKPRSENAARLAALIAKTNLAAHVFHLPGRRHAVNATTQFTSEVATVFASYLNCGFPFESFKIVFLEDTYNPVDTGASFAIVNSQLMSSDSVIEGVYESRKLFTKIVAQQWLGHFLTPRSWTDGWLFTGMTNYLTAVYLRRSFGKNEVLYRSFKDAERLVLMDITQPPLCPVSMTQAQAEDIALSSGMVPPSQVELISNVDPMLVYQNPIDEACESPRAEFVNLKAPLVLQMMDKRLGRGSLSKVLSRFCQEEKNGSLSEGISTQHFLRRCKEVSSKADLLTFATQWIYGAGIPHFQIAYQVNTRRGMIEVQLKQENPSFKINTPGAVESFQGTMTLRVHEPQGAFDTEIDIRKNVQQFQVLYHSKYRRNVKRKAGDKKDEDEDDEEDFEVTGEADKLFNWIRVDANANWIGDKIFNQPESKWVAQLKGDRDVLAQLEAIAAIRRSRQDPVPLLNAIKNPDLYYGIRVEAALSVTGWVNPVHQEDTLLELINEFVTDYCHPVPNRLSALITARQATIPRPNNFTDFANYFRRQAMPAALSGLRFYDTQRNLLLLRQILFNLLRFNDNGENRFSDAYLMASLIQNLGTVVMPSDTTVEPPEASEFLKEATTELRRLMILDRISPSHQNVVTVACLQVLTRWMGAGLLPVDLPLFLNYTKYGNSTTVRSAAIDSVILLDGMLIPPIAKYLLSLVTNDPSPFIRYHTIQSFVDFVAIIMGDEELFAQEMGVKAVAQSLAVKGSEVSQDVGPQRDGEDQRARAVDVQSETIDGNIGEVGRSRIVSKKVGSATMLDLYRRQISLNENFADMIWEVLNNSGPRDARIIFCLFKYCDLLLEPAPETVAKNRLRLGIRGTTVGANLAGNEVTTPLVTPASAGSAFSKHAIAAVESVDAVPETLFDRVAKDVVNKLKSNSCIQPFLHPVVTNYPEIREDYLSKISQPMDVDTIELKVVTHLYNDDLSALARDVRLIVTNCYAYNAPDSGLNQLAAELSETFEDDILPAAAHELGVDYFTVQAEPIPPPAIPRRAAPTQKILEEPKEEEEEEEVQVDDLEDLGIPVYNVQHEQKLSPEDLERCRNTLKKFASWDLSAPFRRPIDPRTPGYKEKITHPMDMSSIKDKLNNGYFETLADFEKEFRLIFWNCYVFNGRNHEFSRRAQWLEMTFDKEFATTKSSDLSDVISVKIINKGEKYTDIGDGLKPSDADFQRMRLVLLQLIVLDLAEGFRDPVDEFKEPEYYDAIKNPICFADIINKLMNSHYHTTDEMHADLKVMFANCREYNKGGLILEQCKLLEDYFDRCWKEFVGPEPTVQPQALVPPQTFCSLVPENKDAAILYVEKTIAHPLATHFLAIPSRLDPEIPDYHHVITHPIALCAIRDKLRLDAYNTIDDLESDVRLMYRNCKVYNPKDSEIHDECMRFEKNFGTHGIRMTNVMRLTEYFKLGHNLNGISLSKDGEKVKLSDVEKMRAHEVLNHLRSIQGAFVFEHPVTLKGYRDVILHPVCFSDVENRVNSDGYHSMREFWRDLRTIFANCRQFNGFGEYYQMAVEFDRCLDKIVGHMTEKITDRKEVPDYQKPIIEVPTEKEYEAEQTKDIPRTFEPPVLVVLSDEEKLKAHQILQNLKIYDREYFDAVFVEKPYIKGYDRVILRPMWYRKVEENLHIYKTFAEFEADVRLIYNNCRQFNAALPYFVSVADDEEQVFDKLLAGTPFAEIPRPTLTRPVALAPVDVPVHAPIHTAPIKTESKGPTLKLKLKTSVATPASAHSSETPMDLDPSPFDPNAHSPHGTVHPVSGHSMMPSPHGTMNPSDLHTPIVHEPVQPVQTSQTQPMDVDQPLPQVASNPLKLKLKLKTSTH